MFPPSLRAELKSYVGNYDYEADPATIARLTKAVKPLCPPGSYIGPSVEFGPYHVNGASGKSSDFCLFGDLGQLGAKPSAIERLTALEVNLPPSQEVVTKASHRCMRNVREFQILPLVEAGPSLGLDAVERCKACGEFLLEERLALPHRITVAQKSVPEGDDLFRWKPYEHIFLASERFVQAYRELGLTGLRLLEVKLE
jgi:hypothetical protein